MIYRGPARVMMMSNLDHFFAGVGSVESEHRYNATVECACIRMRLQSVNQASYSLAYLDIPWEAKSNVLLTRYV